MEGEPAKVFNIFSDDWFPAAEAGARRVEERWHEGPVRMGVMDVREESLSWPDVNTSREAAAARAGSAGDQFVVPFQGMGNSRGHGVDLRNHASWRMWNVDTGAELAPAPSGRVFTLAPGTATYRLEQVEQSIPFQPVLTGKATTIWTFLSRPSDEQVPQHYKCPLRDHPSNPQQAWSFVCQIQPLIRLEYDLGLDIHNRAMAGRAHRFTITAGQHSKAIDRAPITYLRVQASFDDGETWLGARVIGRAKDSWSTGGFLPSAAPYQQFRVVLAIPPLHRTTGFVTLRVQATDANGGTVDQTINRAYVLK